MIRKVDSTSDERVVNNVMRHEYRVLTDEEKAQMLALKDKCLELYQLLQKLPECREVSIALTHCEEVAMWGVKAITR